MGTLLAIGDWGRGGAPGQRAVAAGLAAVARETSPRAVLTLGDNFYERGVEAVDDPTWESSFEAVYSDPALQVPWCAVLGNHDHAGSVEAQHARSRLRTRWQLPAFHWRRELDLGGGATLELIALDTTPLCARYRSGGAEPLPGLDRFDPARQLAWLELLLRQPAPTWRVVVGHHPLLSGSPFHGPTEDLAATLLPLLERYGVDLYLSGHEHDLQHLVRRGLHHVVCGAGAESRATGETPETVFASGELGFCSLTADTRTLDLRLHAADGSVRHRALLDAPDRVVAARPERRVGVAV